MSEREGAISVIIRTVYIMVLLMHIPYFFFTTKEYVLVIYDELLNRSLSNHLETKLADFYKRKGIPGSQPDDEQTEENKPLLVKREAELHPTVERPETIKTLETD